MKYGEEVRADALREISETLMRDRGAVRDSGYGMFRELLRYKLERRGKVLILVDRYTPTTRTCSVCGKPQDSVSYKKKTWVCPGCGTVHQREVNAARNIKQEGLAQFCA